MARRSWTSRTPATTGQVIALPAADTGAPEPLAA
jgi:hypothetical protein